MSTCDEAMVITVLRPIAHRVLLRVHSLSIFTIGVVNNTDCEVESGGGKP